MKCAKCGYISFDYLSECKKCQTSMTAARQTLGFSAAKPAVPSLLGSLLLHDDQPQAQQKDHAADTETGIAFSSQEQISGALNEVPRFESAAANQAAADSGETQEDFSLLDLSDEELELLIEKDVLAEGEKKQTRPAGTAEEGGDNDPPGQVFSANADTFSPEIAMPEAPDAAPTPEQVLSFDNFFETENAQPLDLETDSGDEPEKPEIEPSLTLDFDHAEQHSAEPPADSPDDFVIDLSESDLEALLKRLEGSSKEKV